MQAEKNSRTVLQSIVNIGNNTVLYIKKFVNRVDFMLFFQPVVGGRD